MAPPARTSRLPQYYCELQSSIEIQLAASNIVKFDSAGTKIKTRDESNLIDSYDSYEHAIDRDTPGDYSVRSHDVANGEMGENGGRSLVLENPNRPGFD